MNTQTKSNTGLLPHLGLLTTVAIVTGAVIGSGIFKKPAMMAAQLGSPELMLALWVLAGILTLFGALTNAEVAGLISETGGQYVYFEKMYGKLAAFLYGWAIFAVIQTGSIASITYVFAEYTEYFWVLPRLPSEIENNIFIHIPFIGKIFPLANIGVKAVTIFVILFLSSVNYFGVRFGGRIALFFTASKVLAILALVAFAFSSDYGSIEHFTRDSVISASSTGLLGGILIALSGAFWSYDGWNNVTYLAGEIKNPQKTIPRALFFGTLIVISVYLLINSAFLYILPVEEMAQSHLVAADVAKKALGALGGAFVAAAVMISTFGTANGTIMASSRVYFAMAKKKMFFSPLAYLHPTFKTPTKSLIVQAAWACVLVLSGTFDILTDMLIFVSWVFYAFGAIGVFVLRKKMPDTHRPYKVLGYPYIPIIFIVFAFAFVVFTVYNDIVNYYSGNTQIINSLFGLLLVVAGLPLYAYFNSKNKKSNQKLI